MEPAEFLYLSLLVTAGNNSNKLWLETVPWLDFEERFDQTEFTALQSCPSTPHWFDQQGHETTLPEWGVFERKELRMIYVGMQMDEGTTNIMEKIGRLQ